MLWCKNLIKDTEENFARFYSSYSSENHHHVHKSRLSNEFQPKTITVGPESNSVVIVPSDTQKSACKLISRKV